MDVDDLYHYLLLINTAAEVAQRDFDAAADDDFVFPAPALALVVEPPCHLHQHSHPVAGEDLRCSQMMMLTQVLEDNCFSFGASC